jgi:transcriptional/translational regulatory protein YebC/TACO1
VAAREAGRPDHNAALARPSKAVDANMPHDNTDRAVKKGRGAGADAEAYQHLTHEGYGPNGVAAHHDPHRQQEPHGRRHPYTFDQAGANWAPTARQLDVRARGHLHDAAGKDEDEVMMAIEAGAEDGIPEGDAYDPVRRGDRLSVRPRPGRHHGHLR